MKGNTSDRCNYCSDHMSHFKGYIPKIGNVCKTCYDKLVLDEEFPNIRLDGNE